MLTAFVVRQLLKLGLSRAGADRSAPWVAGLLIFALLGAILGILLHLYVRGEIKNHENAAAARVAPAHAEAAGERAADTIHQAKQEEQAHDAIQSSGPDTLPAPAAVAHNCNRLRRAGIVESRLPAPCRPGGGDGTQAAARP